MTSFNIMITRSSVHTHENNCYYKAIAQHHLGLQK